MVTVMWFWKMWQSK